MKRAFNGSKSFSLWELFNNDENKMTRKINLILHSEAYVHIYLFERFDWSPYSRENCQILFLVFSKQNLEFEPIALNIKLSMLMKSKHLNVFHFPFQFLVLMLPTLLKQKPRTTLPDFF